MVMMICLAMKTLTNRYRRHKEKINRTGITSYWKTRTNFNVSKITLMTHLRWAKLMKRAKSMMKVMINKLSNCKRTKTHNYNKTTMNTGQQIKTVTRTTPKIETTTMAIMVFELIQMIMMKLWHKLMMHCLLIKKRMYRDC